MSLVPLVPDDPNSLAFAGQGDKRLHHNLTAKVVAALQNLKNGEFFAMSGGHDDVARHIEFEAVRGKEADLIEEVEDILSSKFPWMMGGEWKEDTSWGRGGSKPRSLKKNRGPKRG